MPYKNQLILFTRFPTPGKTKTRLIPHLGAERAAQLQKEMTGYTVRQARKSGSEVEIRFTGSSLEQMRDWLGEDLHYAEQGPGDLGERMERAFADHFSAGAERVVVIGSDCPANDGEHMEKAFRELEGSECVIGPANDGGYYLIGLNAPAPYLFQGMSWGDEQVFEQTMNAASALIVSKLKPLNDVDLFDDIPPRISVVIPTLNEMETLPKTLEKVNEGFNIEVSVVDGGSTDGTCSIIPEGLECLDGRAAQQNRGAASATGEILVFLHADTELPDGWDWIVRDALSDPSVAAGAFSFKIAGDFLGQKFVENSTNWRSKKIGLPYGDQGLFLCRETFDRAGGFPDLPIMEDYAFVRTLRRYGKIVTVPHPVITSGRRWQQHGVFKVTVVNKLMILGYHLGLSPERLARFYRKR